MLISIYKITNLHNNEVYVGQTTQDIQKRFNVHIGSEKFRRYVAEYGKDILKLIVLKQVNKENALKEEAIETIRCIINNEKVLNKHCGATPVEFVMKIINENKDLSADEVYEKIINKRNDCNCNFGNKKTLNEIVYVTNLQDKKVYISHCSSFEEIKYENYTIIGIFPYNVACEKCLDECIKYALNGFTLINKHCGKYKSHSVLRIINEFYINLDFDTAKKEITQVNMYRIYKITNLVTNKVYVGRTKNLTRYRFLNHYNSQSELGKDMKKYGLENFTLEILCFCQTKCEADKMEQFYTEKFLSQNVYNLHKSDLPIDLDSYIIYKISYKNDVIIRVDNFKLDIHKLLRGSKFEKIYSKYRDSVFDVEKIGSISKSVFECFDIFHNENMFNNLQKFINSKYSSYILDIKNACENVYQKRYNDVLASINQKLGYISYICFEVLINDSIIVCYDRSIVLAKNHIEQILNTPINSSNCKITILGQNLSHSNAKNISIRRQVELMFQKAKLIYNINEYHKSIVEDTIKYMHNSTIELVYNEFIDTTTYKVFSIFDIELNKTYSYLITNTLIYIEFLKKIHENKYLTERFYKEKLRFNIDFRNNDYDVCLEKLNELMKNISVYNNEKIEKTKNDAKVIKAWTWSKEMRKKFSNAHKGQKPSEYCLKRSLEIHLGSKQSKETIEKRRKNLTKRVICVNTQEVFDSKEIAAKKFNLDPYKIWKHSKKHESYGEFNNEKLYWIVLTTQEKKELVKNNYSLKYIKKLCDDYMCNVK